MVMSHQRTPRLKPFLDRVPPGFLVDTAWLKRFGIDSKSIHNYAERGWLERMAHGVYRRPLPHADQAGRPIVRTETDWQLPLLSIQWIMGHDVHLGGLSAVGFHGLAHYLPLGGGERVYLYGEVPSWLARLPGKAQFVVRSRVLFGENHAGVENAEYQFESAPGAGHGPTMSPWRWPIMVSSPERAILEALNDLPVRATFDNLDMIFQGLVNLRPERLTTLLRACRSIKAKRLFFVFADRHAHAWTKYLDKSAIDLGSGPRALVKGGKLHPVYRIYVPAELLPRGKDENLRHA